jgi:hypothetical protein
MPAKRQRPLPFQRTVIKRATRSSITTSDNPPSRHSTPAPSDSFTATSIALTPTFTPRARSPAPPLPERTKQLRNS